MSAPNPVTGGQLAYPKLRTPLARVFGSFWQGWVLRGYNEVAILLPVINQFTPGATNTPAWDPVRRQVTAFTDGSFGVGWQAIDPDTGAARMGYLAPQQILVGINDTATSSQLKDYGVVNYEGPVVIYQPPIALKKFDVLVRPDGSRCVVGDHLAPAQVWGETILWTAALEARKPNDIVYSIPLA